MKWEHHYVSIWLTDGTYERYFDTSIELVPGGVLIEGVWRLLTSDIDNILDITDKDRISIQGTVTFWPNNSIINVCIVPMIEDTKAVVDSWSFDPAELL